MTDNCTHCLYSYNDTTSLLINDLFKTQKFNEITCMKCNHINSPFYNELVDEETICRLFVDSHEYFLLKDRRENIEELKRKMRFKK